MQTFSRIGHLDLSIWAISQGCIWDDLICSYADSNGHWESLKWAKSLDWRVSGHLELIKWARISDSDPLALNSHLELLRWARSCSQGCFWDTWTCASAASNGYSELLQWARSSAADLCEDRKSVPWYNKCKLCHELNQTFIQSLISYFIQKIQSIDKHLFCDRYNNTCLWKYSSQSYFSKKQNQK